MARVPDMSLDDWVGLLPLDHPAREEFLELRDMVDRIGSRFWSQVKKTDGCWEWTGCKDAHGYGRFTYKRSLHTHRDTRSAHRFSWSLINGPVPRDLQILHHCDNRACVRPDHLYAGTLADNMADRGERGRTARGERHGRTRLSDSDVVDMRRAWGAGECTQKGLAQRYNMSVNQVAKIVRGEAWKHIPMES